MFQKVDGENAVIYFISARHLCGFEEDRPLSDILQEVLITCDALLNLH
jgi:hypothetical protein